MVADIAKLSIEWYQDIMDGISVSTTHFKCIEIVSEFGLCLLAGKFVWHIVDLIPQFVGFLCYTSIDTCTTYLTCGFLASLHYTSSEKKCSYAKRVAITTANLHQYKLSFEYLKKCLFQTTMCCLMYRWSLQHLLIGSHFEREKMKHSRRRQKYI